MWMRVTDKQSSWSLYGDQLWLLPQVQAEIMVSQHLPLPLPVFPDHFPLRVQQSTALGTPYLWDIPTSFTPVAMETATDMPRRCKHPKLGVCFSGQELCVSLLLLHPPTLPQPWHGGGGGRCWNPKYQIRGRNIASWAVLNIFGRGGGATLLDRSVAEREGGRHAAGWTRTRDGCSQP